MMTELTYPHPRPGPPAQLYLLAALAICGLAALWLAAFHAFSHVASPAQAFFAASLIEAGLIIEALALVKRGPVWYIVAAVVVSLAVSGTYNYIQAATIAGDSFNWWQLGTLALGPLAALAFVSLTLGHELREHQAGLEKWEADRAGWTLARRQEAEAYQRQQEEERQSRLWQMQEAERERQEREAERRFKAEERERAWQRRQAERKERPAEPARAALEPARAALKCEQCGATAGKSGAPFRTQAALNAHQAHCPGPVLDREPVVVSSAATNGKGH